MPKHRRNPLISTLHAIASQDGEIDHAIVSAQTLRRLNRAGWVNWADTGETFAAELSEVGLAVLKKNGLR